MYTRRRITGLLGTAALAATAGCGFLTGEESLTFEAEPAEADEATAEETGYEYAGTEAQTVERDFEVAGETRTVEVTNRVATYEKTVESPLLGEARLGVFAALSSPAVEVAGETFNPVADFSNAELVDLVASNYESLETGEEADRATWTVLGNDVEVSQFDATATFEGQEVDVFVHVGSTRDGDDFVVPLAIYPQDREENERPNARALAESLVHPAE